LISPKTVVRINIKSAEPARTIRAAARSRAMEQLRESVPAEVAGYIEKYELYQN